MTEESGKTQAAPTLPRALARLCGLYLGALALGLTYTIAVLRDVQAPTALLRAVIVGFVFAVIGRVLGWIAGRSFEASLRTREPVEVETDAEAAA